MDNTFVHSDAPVEHSEGSAPSEAYDVKRLVLGTNDLVGPIVVVGLYGADCFRWMPDGPQAGTTDPYAYGKDKFAANDGDEDDTFGDQNLRHW